MLTSKQTTLKPLLESKEGVHLTVYLVNRGDLIDLKTQLRTLIAEAYKWLSAAMSEEEQKKFLEPLHSLLNDARIFKQMKGNIGIFRNKDSFRVLNIPVEVEKSCQVATSFHVKPLLRWLQVDQEFLFLGLEKEYAHLYSGSQDSFKLIDSILFPEAYAWLNEWIAELTKNSKPRLFVAGEPLAVQTLLKTLKYKNMDKNAIANLYNNQNAIESCQKIRKLLKDDSKKLLEKTLMEFRYAEEGNRTRKNIFQIARAVVKGRVRKLVVTDELSIFGKIDQNSGGISIHPFDLDHEDDCILDDLAQMVLSQGGEVVVAKRNEIPKGRPILAILDNDVTSLEKTEEFKHEVLQERFG